MSLQKTVYGFVPTSITGCALWLDAADSSSFNSGSISSGNTITNWSDKSGTNQSITVGGTPVWNSTTLNNYPSVNTTNGRFSGIFSTPLSLFTNTTFVVTSLTSYPTGGYPCVAFQNTTSEGAIFLRILDYAGGYRFIAFFSSLGYTASQTASLATPFLWTTTYGGSTSASLNVNGGSSISGTFVSPGSSAAYFYVGTEQADVPNVNTWPGYVSEVIVYNSALGTTERQQVEGYLAQKWGLTSSLPASHPGRNTTIYRADYTKQNVMSARPYYTAFTPRQIAGCTLWLDGTDPAGNGVVPSAGTLETWVDKSGSGNNATQSTGANRPTYSNNGLVFSGSQSYQTQITSFPTAESIFIVFRTTTGVANIFAGTTGNSREVILYTGNKIFLGRFGTDPSSTTPNSGVISLNTNILYSTQYTSSVITFNVNGSTTGSGTPPFTYSGTGTTWIGGNGYAPNNMYGTIYELIYYNSSLSSTLRQQVESYLAQKWDLTASLPGGHSHLTQPAGAITLTALTNFRTLSQPRRYISFRWTITAGNTSDLIQFSEFQVGFNSTQIVFASPTTATTGSSISWNTGAGEGPAQAVDNNTGTKGLGIGTSGLVLIVTVATPIAANMYRWATANDVTPGRNPTQWTVDGSADNATYVRLHTQNTAYSTPSSTFTFTSWIPFT
jgi:hypothetical protein